MYKTCFLLPAPRAEEPRFKQRPAGPAASPASGAQAAGPVCAWAPLLPRTPACAPAVQERAAGNHGPALRSICCQPGCGERARRAFRPHAIPKGCSKQTTAKTGPASPEDG